MNNVIGQHSSKQNDPMNYHEKCNIYVFMISNSAMVSIVHEMAYRSFVSSFLYISYFLFFFFFSLFLFLLRQFTNQVCEGRNIDSKHLTNKFMSPKCVMEHQLICYMYVCTPVQQLITASNLMNCIKMCVLLVRCSIVTIEIPKRPISHFICVVVTIALWALIP